MSIENRGFASVATRRYVVGEAYASNKSTYPILGYTYRLYGCGKRELEFA